MKLRYKLCNILNLEPSGHYKMCYAMCMYYTLEILFYVRYHSVVYYVVICVFWAANVMCIYVMCQHVENIMTRVKMYHVLGCDRV